MIFGTTAKMSKMAEVKLEHANKSLQRTETYKYLGVKLDTRLSFSEHISYLKGKTYAKIKLLRRLNHVLDTNTLSILCKSLILPIFDYADITFQKLNQYDEITL